MSEATARWRANNPEKAKVSARRSAAKWRKNNPDKSRARKKQWRADNPEKACASARTQQAGIRERNGCIIRAAKDKACADCGTKYPYYVMDLDHVRGIKTSPVSIMVLCGTKRLLAEIAKCEVVCSNCHRERTHARLQRT